MNMIPKFVRSDTMPIPQTFHPIQIILDEIHEDKLQAISKIINSQSFLYAIMLVCCIVPVDMIRVVIITSIFESLQETLAV